LGDERWRERLCLSSSSLPENAVLVAFLIRRHGVRDAEIIVREWRANLATTVFPGDAELLEALADGRCGIGIVDSALLASFAGVRTGLPVAAHWFSERANTLTDISAAAVTRHATQPDAAEALLEWLSRPGPNGLFAGRRFEFPANPDAELASAVESGSGRLPDDTAYAELGFLLEEADLLVERARYP
jgi:iron(III) transport system substrate-binding protein